MKSDAPRAVVRKSTNHVTVQIVQTAKEGVDHVMASGHTKELAGFGYTGHGGNVPAAYLAGYLAGLRMGKKTEDAEAIVDLGVQTTTHGTRLFAAVNGIMDAGIKVKVDPVAFPSNERLSGKHIAAFSQKEPSKMNRTQFSRYVSKKVDVQLFSEMVEAAKKNMSERA